MPDPCKGGVSWAIRGRIMMAGMVQIMKMSHMYLTHPYAPPLIPTSRDDRQRRAAAGDYERHEDGDRGVRTRWRAHHAGEGLDGDPGASHTQPKYGAGCGRLGMGGWTGSGVGWVSAPLLLCQGLGEDLRPFRSHFKHLTLPMPEPSNQVAVEKNDILDAGDLVVYIDTSKAVAADPVAIIDSSDEE